MSISRVIINSSPLIVLFKSQQAELLPQLFAEILVPEGVFVEVTMAGENDAAAKRRGLISSISPGIQALRDAGLWLSEFIVNLLKQQAGE